MDDVGTVLAEVQQLFGFGCYYVFDTSRLAEEKPVSFLYPSNIAASFFYQVSECLADYASIFMQIAENPGASLCDLAEAETLGRVTPDAAIVFRSAGMIRGVTFPALGISGAPRLIGFSGDRAHLHIDELEELNVLMFHAHARLTIVGRAQVRKKEPLSGLEREVLFLAAEGESFETISAHVALSSRTINYLVDSICSKMEVATIEHAVAVTLRRRLVL